MHYCLKGIKYQVNQNAREILICLFSSLAISRSVEIELCNYGVMWWFVVIMQAINHCSCPYGNLQFPTWGSILELSKIKRKSEGLKSFANKSFNRRKIIIMSRKASRREQFVRIQREDWIWQINLGVRNRRAFQAEGILRGKRRLNLRCSKVFK